MAAAFNVLADEVASVQTVEEEQNDSIGIELSTRVGVRDLRKNDYYKLGPAIQIDFKARLGDSPFDFVLRCYGTIMDVDDEYVDALGGTTYYVNGRPTAREYDTFRLDDGSVTFLGGTAAVQFNFARDEKFNPYLAAGAAYEHAKYDLDYTIYRRYAYSYGSHVYTGSNSASMSESESKDGTAFVARAGMEFNFAPFFATAECGWMTKLYKDEDEAQVVLAGRLGFSITESCRIDAGVDYYTEWEDIFFSAGLGFIL